MKSYSVPISSLANSLLRSQMNPLKTLVVGICWVGKVGSIEVFGRSVTKYLSSSINGI